MEDHGGHPGLVSQLTTLGHNFGDYDLWDCAAGRFDSDGDRNAVCRQQRRWPLW